MRRFLILGFALVLAGCTPETTTPKAKTEVKLPTTSTATFDQDVLLAKKPVLVDFGASWCGPCRMMEPALANLAKNYTVFKVDVDAEPGLAQRYAIRSIPVSMIFVAGQPVSRHVGVVPEQTLHQELAEYSANSAVK
jgi:thioredoxin 1